jgi:membrane protease YdiL (CAAX protease family)
VFAVVFFIAPFLLIQAGATHYFEEKLYSRLGPFFGACMGCISYACYFTTVEKRAVSELSTNNAAAGVLLASAFLRTGRLWLCAASHAAWNFFQDEIFQ